MIITYLSAICVTEMINVEVDLLSQGGPLPEDWRLHLWVVSQIWETVRAEDLFTFEEKPHHSLVFAPLGAAICLANGPKACFTHLPQRS